MQYTIHGIPAAVHAALRRRARAEGKSLNEVTVDALVNGTGVSGTPFGRRDLSDIAGTWHEDSDFDAALASQDQVGE